MSASSAPSAASIFDGLVVTHGDVRRAKLYYLRGKAAKIKEKREATPAS